MAEGNWSVIRVEKISAEGAQKTERHNERKNESYANLNVDTEKISRNVYFKDTGGLTYNEYFQRLIDEGKISTRGQKAGATIFNELVIDVNTRYFEEHGGYEYAKQFYEEAYRFGCEIYGEENIVSAVMHADEVNKAVSEELGKPVYHYHLHIVAIPTVRKEILWSKRCKDEALRGTVKEVINQVSHSKKWKNTVPLLDENGQQVISKYGKPMFRKSYSVLQDKLFEHMPIGMLVVLDSILNRITQNRAKGKNTFIFIDEIYLLFQHEYSANFLFTLWKRVRKYGAYATGITQNVDDLLQSHTARTMLANSEFIVMLNQASTDRLELAKLLNISDTQLSYITNVDAGHGLIKVGSSLVPFANKFPKNTKLYKLMTTKPGEGA